MATNGDRHARAAAFFDLDKTIIAKSATLAFSRPFYAGGLINRRAALRSAYAQFVYLVGGADERRLARMRDDITRLVAGWDVQQVKDIVAETLYELIDPYIYDEAASLIEEHKAAGRAVVVISTSGEEVVAPIAEMVGADHVVATRMVVEDGRYTGEIAFYAYGQAKADAVRDLAAEQRYDLAECYAYSDSHTDLPMLAEVGHPNAVNPDRALRREAVSRGWPVLDFAHPVPLRSRVPAFGPRPLLTGAAVGMGAAAIGLAWRTARRRARG